MRKLGPLSFLSVLSTARSGEARTLVRTQLSLLLEWIIRRPRVTRLSTEVTVQTANVLQAIDRMGVCEMLRMVVVVPAATWQLK